MNRFETMPKVELHLHLEGAIPLAAMWHLVEAHGGDPDLPDAAALADRYTYRDFVHFIDTWVWKNRFLDSYEAFEFAAEAVARELEERTIHYAEVFFSPSDFRVFGLQTGELAMAIRRGLDSIEGAEVALIADLVRDTGPEGASRTLDEVLEVASDAKVIGVGIGGSEADYPPEPFADVYRRAADAGLHLTAHAGEAAGPESIRGALDALHAERIGHGVRAVEDVNLVVRLVADQVPLEVCPTSNLRTGIVTGWEGHPAERLIEAGAMVTLNTDDPAMFGSTLAGEFAEVEERFGLDDATLRRLAANAVDASWAEPPRKAVLHEQLRVWWEVRG